MVATINNFCGFETGGLEEASALAGSFNVVTSPVGSGTYVLEIIGTTGEYTLPPFPVADAGNDYIIGVRFASPNLSQSNVAQFCRIRESGTAVLILEYTTSNELILRDQGGTALATLSSFHSAINTFRYIEVYFQHSTSGDWELFVDNASEDSGSGADFSNAGSIDEIFFAKGNSGNAVHVDDVYFMSGVADATDRLGPAEIFKYQSDKASSTPDDGGDVLDVGNWGDAGVVPFPATVQIEYTDAGAGAVDSDGTNGSPEGPLNDSRITGTIDAIKGIWTMERAGGGATDHYGLLGNNVDGTTRSADFDPASGTPGNFYFVSESAAIVPTTGQYCRIGIESTGAQDFECYGMSAMILHVPPPSGDIEGAVSFAATATNTPTADADLEAARVEAGTATNTETADANLFAALTETVTAGDAVAAGLETDHAVAESATAGDVMAAEVMLGSDVTFAATASMTYVSEALLAADFDAAATATNTEAAQADLEASASESATATNVEDEDANFEASITENSTATNAEVSMVTTDVDVSESATASDSVDNFLSIVVDLTEATTASIAEDAQADLEASRSESTTATNTEVGGIDQDAALTESATATVTQVSDVSIEGFVNFGATATIAEDVQAAFFAAFIETVTATMAQVAQLDAEGQLATSVTVSVDQAADANLEASISFDPTQTAAFDVDANLAAQISDTVTTQMIAAGAISFESGLTFSVTAGDVFTSEVAIEVAANFDATHTAAFVSQLPSLNATLAITSTAGDQVDAVAIFDAQVTEAATATVAQEVTSADLGASVSEAVTASDITAGGVEIDTAVVFGASMAVAVVGAIVGFTGGRRGGVAVVKAQNRRLTVRFQGRKVS